MALPASHASFVSNIPPETHEKVMRAALRRGNDVFLATAFLKQSGLNRLHSDLADLLQRRGRVTAVVGLDFFQTEPAALFSLHTLEEKGNFQLFLFLPDLATFHPKYTRISTTDGIEALVGSANLTSGGMEQNFEASIFYRARPTSLFAAECRAFEASLLAAPRCRAARLVDIELYRERYDAWHRAVDTVEKIARKRLSRINPSSVIGRYLIAYRISAKDQTDFARRKRNYTKARAVLRQIGRPHPLSAQQFRFLYERLVGAPGQKGLWHSGGLFRQKNFVIEKHRQTQVLIRDLSRNLHLSPRDLFALGRSHSASIPNLGTNVLTEIMHALRPQRFPVLNNNPLTGLRELANEKFTTPNSFKPDTYERYAAALIRFGGGIGSADFGTIDHFLNFIYWQIKDGTRGRPTQSYAA